MKKREGKVRIRGKDYDIPAEPGKEPVLVTSLPGTQDVLVFRMEKSEDGEHISASKYSAEKGKLVFKEKVGDMMARPVEVKGKKVYNVFFLKVDPEHRKKGIGEVLISLARNRAVSNKADVIEFPKHEEFKEFYKRQGIKHAESEHMIRLGPKGEIVPDTVHKAEPPEKIKPKTRMQVFYAGMKKKRRK